ncbi:hypothetical protein BCE02nite_32250 [Brevibacillus centrosporus]|nr:hypothetical protein BCE02nite_32250 [Brevibacillus centrosporus]
MKTNRGVIKSVLCTSKFMVLSVVTVGANAAGNDATWRHDDAWRHDENDGHDEIAYDDD